MGDFKRIKKSIIKNNTFKGDIKKAVRSGSLAAIYRIIRRILEVMDFGLGLLDLIDQLVDWANRKWGY